MKEEDIKINIILSQTGVERVQILGGVEKQEAGLRLYDSIATKIKYLDRALKKERYNHSIVD